jgi:3-oxoacyl-[acyl-carrier protein] reductase
MAGTTAEFAGRVALVTGGSRGIGRATALRLAAEGADVAISYRTRGDDAQTAVAAIEAAGAAAIAVACDVSQPDQVQHLVDQVRHTLGPIDLLVHGGAISNLCEHSELTYQRWQETIDVNLTGTYLTVFAVKEEMIRRGFGRIVLVSSVAALRPRALQIHYAAAKAGVIALTRCLAEALAPHHIRVNCVAPGLTETEMMHVLTPETIANVVQSTPLGRVAQPEEIASVIRFLLSEESSFMTGQTLVACGGRVMVP